ncbi:catalase [Helicobacter aurati]
MIGVFSSLLLLNAKDTQIQLKEYDAEKIADVFYALNGNPNDPHKKINHAKGFCTRGEFIPAKNITKKFDIPLLAEKNIPTQIRYSLGGGNPQASDKSKPRGIALKIEGKNDSWEIVALNTEINFAKNPNEFGTFFAMQIPKNGKVDKANIAKLTEEVDSYRNFAKYMEKIGITGSVANTMYHSIHTFFMKDSRSKKFVPARFKLVPVAGVSYLNQEELRTKDDNFLEADFKNKIAQKPIEYKLVFVLANPEDSIYDTTALWSGKHKEIEVGTLKVSKYDGTDCNRDVFMPNVLPNGIGQPQDPLFDVRNETYSITFGRRQ